MLSGVTRRITSSADISRSTLPVISCVSVATPSRIFAIYSLSLSAMRSASFVALPKHTGSTPSACGSSVPVCPILRICNMPRSLATTSLDVYPCSFLITSMPVKSFSVLCIQLLRDFHLYLFHNLLPAHARKRASGGSFVSAAAKALRELRNVHFPR